MKLVFFYIVFAFVFFQLISTLFLKYFAFLCRSIATHIGKKLGIREIVPRKPPSNPYLEDAFKKSRNPSYDVIQVCIFLLEIYFQ